MSAGRKVLFVGDAECGKSSLLNSFIKGSNLKVALLFIFFFLKKALLF